MKRYLCIFGTAITVLILDQLTKAWALANLEMATIGVTPNFNLVLLMNKGVSFGMLGGGGPWVLIALSLVIISILAVWLVRTTHIPLCIALAAVIGGALGNVIDRVVYGAVIDFLDFHAFDWHYPAFNIADSAIVLGIAFVVFDGLLLEPKRKRVADHGKPS